MSTMKDVPTHHQAVILDTSDNKISRLVIEVPPEQEQAIQDALETLSRMETGISAQTVVLAALHIAAEQTYFWTPEWQAKEQAADQAIAEGRVQTFDTMDQILKKTLTLERLSTSSEISAHMKSTANRNPHF